LRRRPGPREYRIAPAQAVGRLAREADEAAGGAHFAVAGERFEELHLADGRPAIVADGLRGGGVIHDSRLL